MITLKIVEFFSNLIPQITMPFEVIGAFTEVISWAMVVNYYVPFNTFVACLAVYLVVWGACVIVSAILSITP